MNGLLKLFHEHWTVLILIQVVLSILDICELRDYIIVSGHFRELEALLDQVPSVDWKLQVS